MLDKEWVIANVHLAHEYRESLASPSGVHGLSGDLYHLIELLKGPLSPTSQVRAQAMPAAQPRRCSQPLRVRR